MCCTRLAANAGHKKVAKNRHLGTIPQLCRAIYSELRHVSTIWKKNLLSSNISSTCPHNMVNFSPLAAEILSLVWGTPRNFNGFRVLAALLDGTLVVGVSQTGVQQRAPPIFGRATITLGIGPHSSLHIFFWIWCILLCSIRLPPRQNRSWAFYSFSCKWHYKYKISTLFFLKIYYKNTIYPTDKMPYKVTNNIISAI